MITLGLMAVLGGYMVALTIVGQPHKSSKITVLSNQRTLDVRCSFVYPEFQIALFVIEAIILCAGAKLCWAVKDAPDAVNESKYIAIGKLVICRSYILILSLVAN